MPIEEVDKIWMDGELVPWADAKVHVLSHGLHYGSGVFEGIRAYATDRGPAVWHLDAHLERMYASAAIYHMDLPYSKDELIQATKDVIRVERARRVLRPADRLPRVRRDGREPARRARERRDRGMAVGGLPGRGRPGAGRPGQGLVVEAPRPELAAERREGDRRLPGLDPRQGRERDGRLRRGDPAERRRATSPRARGRTSSSSTVGRSSPRRPASGRSPASRGRPVDRRSRETWGSRSSNGTWSGPTCTWPTRSSSPGRRPSSRRSARSTTARSLPATAGRSPSSSRTRSSPRRAARSRVRRLARRTSTTERGAATVTESEARYRLPRTVTPSTLPPDLRTRPRCRSLRRQ